MTPNPKRDKDGVVRHSPNVQMGVDRYSVFINQYAATSQSREINPQLIPGIFFKYDIEPILLIVSERRESFLALLVRLVNVVSGVLVGGGWIYQLSGWMGEVWGGRGSRTSGGGDLGVLHGRSGSLG
jgi:endoplasmic reticulum-Golgi intermediate compartment protein 2